MGKTVVAAKLIGEWEQGNCLFLAHTKELVSQAADKIESELGYRPAVEMNVSTASIDTMYSGGMTIVGSVQTMRSDKRLRKYANYPFGLIIIDECHHATSAGFRKIIDYFRKLNPHLKVVGITATPNRTDGSALGIVFESEAYQMGIVAGIDGGWLVPIKQEYVIVSEICLDNVEVKKNKFGEMDFTDKSAEDIMTDEVLHKMVRPIIEKAGDRPTLIFNANVRQAHEMAMILNDHQPNSAMAIDGTMSNDVRKRAVRDFEDGKLLRLCNFGVFCEGFDAPNCAAIAMARLTKSESVYTQMMGRGLRPLPGVVDGPNLVDAMDRKLSILSSAKPNVLILDFVGNSEHKIASVYDVLGGNYDIETRELAAAEAKTQPNADIQEMLKQAAALIEMERKWAHRKQLVTSANYSSYEVDPFGDGARPALHTQTEYRGGSSDAQVGILVELGVPREKALKYSKKQAGTVIDSVGKTKCTRRQAATLSKHGISLDGVGVSHASRIISAIAANGWKRPEVIPE